MLSPEASAEHGRWNTARVEVARGPMLAISEPGVHTITLKTCTQLMKTEFINNVVGYHIHLDPSPIMVVQPREADAEEWSKKRFAPMLRDTAVLQGKVKDPRARDSDNTILSKTFPGGHITMVASNSPAGLAMRPIRIACCDEVDKYPASAGGEGDPIALITERMATFWNWLLILVCSPTEKTTSRIAASYNESDQRKFFVPCPHCGHEQPLNWSQVQWQKDENGNHLPETAAYACEDCGGLWDEPQRLAAISRGKWIATAPFNGHAGFHINKIASPWEPLAKLVEKFLAARKYPERLKVFINTQLAEETEEQGEKVEWESLRDRRENWGREAPEEVLVITAGVDVQADRLEMEVIGWGMGEENWSLAYRIFHGDPAEREVWAELDKYLQQPIKSKWGIFLHIACCCIDSGGHHTQEVYDFCRRRLGRKVFPVKGRSQAAQPLVGRPTRNNRLKIPLYPVGTDTAKERLMYRLRISEPGAGYCHFPAWYDEEYFRQLTAEQQVTKFSRGQPYLVWQKLRARNEALDCRVYGMAALQILNPNLEALAEEVKQPAHEKKGYPDEQKREGYLPRKKNWLKR